MASSSPLIKQIATGRRKPNMTRKEYFDHRFRFHGTISDEPDNPNEKPEKYVQTQIFDSAFGARPRATGAPLNANYHWCGRDDTTELYFRDWEHVLSVFKSEHVKTKVGPDGPLFADFETSMVLMAEERVLSVNTRLDRGDLDRGDATVAMYFVSTEENERVGEGLEKVLSPALVRALEKEAADEVRGLAVNVGIVSDRFNLNAYFGGLNMPQYALVYKIFLKDNASVPVFRRAQKVFVEEVGMHFDQGESFVLFGKEALILDVGKGKKFDLALQPALGELDGPSHLDK